MSNVRFIADLHFGHKWAAKNRGFSSIEEHNDKIIENWNKIENRWEFTGRIAKSQIREKYINQSLVN